MKKKKIIIVIFIISLLVIVLGLAYALMTGTYFGNSKNVSITGDIYAHFEGSDKIQISNAIPMTKEEALEKTNDFFNFTITGKNTSSKDVYYGISLVEGDVPDGKVGIKPSDIMVYLTSDDNILIDGVRYQDFKNNIYVDKIEAGTTKEIKRNYSLKIWLRDGIIVSDTESYASYSTSEWENIYMSLKVKVDANMSYMNMPLTIEHDDTSVENNKQFFIARLSNYLNPDEVGEMLETNDVMTLEVSSDNSNIEFTYKDSTGEEMSEASDSLTLNYTFNKKQSEEVKVFVMPKNDSNTNVDINVKLTKNNLEVYNQVINMDINGNNYCLNNGFDKLNDCILVSENHSRNVSDAKKYISTKTYNLDDTAPSYTYVEDISYDVVNPSYSYTEGEQYYFSDSLEFNSVVGTYKLTGDIITDTLNDDYIGKYTCGTVDVLYYDSCPIVLKIKEIDETKKIVNADVYTYEISSTLRSEIGLYKTKDDYGDTYFFRGDVENNNVYFAGYYWKIIRMNGDSSVRLIYNGETPDATGNQTGINNTLYTYSPDLGDGAFARYTDPTYVGYMYGENFSETEILSEETPVQSMSFVSSYYFSTGYEYDNKTNTFKLLENDIKYKTYDEMKNENLFSIYPYTCINKHLGSSKDNCQVILKINSYNGITIFGQYISYSSLNAESTRENTKDSNAKIVLDNWYQTNIINQTDNNGNLLEKYITDGTFCNDRTITDGNGYSLVPSTYFSAYNRLYSDENKTAKLKCDDIRDKFSTTSSYGNAKLTYPIALITADEVALAGAKHMIKNMDFYLRSDTLFWTMTPSYFAASYPLSSVYILFPTGELNSWHETSHSFSVRPVINLSPNVLISEGDGTISNPFKLKLA